jgi:IS5 family transposase
LEIGAIVLRTVGDQETLWETVLPEQALGMPAELEAVDRLLDDARFFEPFRSCFDPVWGRPSIPIETYLRLMFLKYRYRMGYETLCREVADSITWQRFCRIGLGGRVPHPTTLMKITIRCGPTVVDQLNELLLAKAAEDKVLKTSRVRADTTVVPANIKYPTDSGLLTKGISKISKAVRRIQAAGAATRTEFRDRTRAARRRAHRIGSKLRRRTGQAKAEVLQITGQLADLAQATVVQAKRVVRNARRALRHRRGDGQLRRTVDDLAVTIKRVERIIDQTDQRLAGRVPEGATRLVSLHDPDARPIRKGSLRRPVQFGYTAQVVDNDDGVIVDYEIQAGNPPDASRLAPAIERITRRLGRPPDAVTADRGYGQAIVDTALYTLDIGVVAIPRAGKPGQTRRQLEATPPFRRLVKWRTGSEGRIATLKRQYGWDRTRLDNIHGARTWCGWGILAHNSVKMAALTT